MAASANCGTPRAQLPRIADIQQDPFCLDQVELKALEVHPRVIVSNEPFVPALDDIPVRFIQAPPRSGLRKALTQLPIAGRVFDWLIALTVALRLTTAMRQRGAVGLISLGQHSGSIFCFLNSFRWIRGGPVVAYRALMPAHPGRLGRFVIGRMLRNVSLIAVWSRAQIENYHHAFDCPRDRFVFLPYKANHSQASSTPMAVGDYLFSGGNSERDYQTLFDAVRGLPIPVIVSATKPAATRGLAIPENVILVSAEEPAFERLMAGSRMMALCVKEDIIRGSGEATILNAMWHGKPVIVADNISAADYIEDGVDGFIVPAGDVQRLRSRILDLWQDRTLADRVGEAGRAKVAKRYTHQQFKTRMQALALLVFAGQPRC